MGLNRKCVKTLCFLSSMTLIIGLTSCQPTPEEAVVQSKQNGNMMRIITSSQALSQYNSPEHFTKHIVSPSKNMSIEVDAVVSTANANKYPVYLVKPRDISNEDADVILHALIGDKPLWATNWGTEVITKDFLDRIILFFRKELAEAKDEDSRAELKRFIDFNEKRYNSAQNSRYEVPALTTFSSVMAHHLLNDLEYEWAEYGQVNAMDATEEDYSKQKNMLLKEIEAGTNLSIEGITDLGDNVEAYINISKSKNNKNNGIYYKRYNYMEETLRDIGYPENPKPDITISEDIALNIAKQTLIKMGIDYMDPIKVEYGYESKEAYLFTFVRNINGTPLSFATTAKSNDANQSYRESWQQESVYLEIDNNAVRYLNWISPAELSEELNPDVPLKDFNTIMDIFSTQALINTVYDDIDPSSSYVTKREFNINKINLGYMTVAKPNSQTEYLLIPVWDFFGYEVDTFSPDYLSVPGHYVLDKYYQRKFEIPNCSYLTINAIDGTIIDRNLGY